MLPRGQLITQGGLYISALGLCTNIRANYLAKNSIQMHIERAKLIKTTGKRWFLFLILCLPAGSSLAQTYVSLAPSITNDVGTFVQKSNVAVEVGRQWDVFSLGLDFGKTSMGKVQGRDTTAYLELRPNLNIFQQGKFTNTFTAGIGYIFNAKNNLMTELTTGIEYALNGQFHFNVFFGQYYYSGKMSASTVTFFGVSGMFYFSTAKSRPLISNPKKQS